LARPAKDRGLPGLRRRITTLKGLRPVFCAVFDGSEVTQHQRTTSSLTSKSFQHASSTSPRFNRVARPADWSRLELLGNIHDYNQGLVRSSRWTSTPNCPGPRSDGKMNSFNKLISRARIVLGKMISKKIRMRRGQKLRQSVLEKIRKVASISTVSNAANFR